MPEYCKNPILNENAGEAKDDLWFWSYQVVVGFDAKQISEVAEGKRGVSLEAEVRIVMSWGQVASLTGM